MELVILHILNTIWMGYTLWSAYGVIRKKFCRRQ